MKWIFFIFICSIFQSSYAELMPKLYCGEANCYDILNAKPNSTRKEIISIFRKLARIWHPDKYKGSNPEDAVKKFSDMTVAYEVLKDEEVRKDYDDMLADPSLYYEHYYRYYRRRIKQDIDIRVVIVFTIILVSLIQYMRDVNNNRTAIKYLSVQPKYRIEAKRIANEQGMLDFMADKKAKRQMSKTEIKKKEQKIIEQIITSKMDIGGSYRPASIKYTFIVQMFFMPYYLVTYIYTFIRWQIRYRILKLEYTDYDKIEVIAGYLKISRAKYNYLDEKKKAEHWAKQLWIHDNFKVL
ncbi:DnaJ subfamily C member 25 [Intoshia linei]|uniref:DnaJ subfamily C member 25 n=1 Tax=Intoshia linei TaxID=1819745 RepID=A0A177BEB0_9BILA|nr:DnaJ subfamily C member 25 [Intoshia linei]